MTDFRIINVDSVQKPRRAVDRFFIHCSASDTVGVGYSGAQLSRTIDRWHKQRGWAGIGYHYTIDKNGNLITGRDLEKTPAAQARHNAATIAVCLHGLEEDKFTDAQIDTLKQLCINYDDLYDGRLTFHGHKEVAAKACPVIDYVNILNLDDHGYLGI